MKPLILFLFLATLMLSGCFYGKPLNTGKTDNNFTYEVSYLFTHDGCDMYRFWDRGQFVYFTNCKGESTAVSDSSRVTTRTAIIR